MDTEEIVKDINLATRSDFSLFKIPVLKLKPPNYISSLYRYHFNYNFSRRYRRVNEHPFKYTPIHLSGCQSSLLTRRELLKLTAWQRSILHVI